MNNKKNRFNDRLVSTIKCSGLCRALLAGLILSVTINAQATHEKNEPSDGTVKSFRAVSQNLPVPKITFFDQNIQPGNISTFKGKIVLLNIWATWCGPCIRELPALDRLQAKFGKDEFVILPISIDEQGIKVTQPFYEQLGLKHLDFYHDTTKQLGRFFPLDVVPANFMIDRQGKLISFLRSFVNWDDEMAEEMINHYLQQPAESPEVWDHNKES